MSARPMSSHPRRAVGPALVLLAALLAAGCGLQTQGVPGAGGAGTGGEAATCTSAAQCDDKNPCTVDKCSSQGLCAHTPLDGVDSPEQHAGDCLINRCVAGEQKSEPDDADVEDDHVECTTDGCKSGVVLHDPKAAGAPCTTMGSPGSCSATGECVVKCSDTKPCPDPGPCASVACDATTGTCVKTPVSDGTPTPGVAQAPGDCHTRVCLGGVDTNQVDPSDVPQTPTDCDDELCDADGVPSNPPHALDSPCSTEGGQVCNGDAAHPACVECNDPTSVQKCPGLQPGLADDDCQHRTCINNKCGIEKSPAGTATTAQTPGDCYVTRCDGNGGQLAVIDDTDVPDDHQDCTSDVCTSGVPSHGLAPAGTTCNGTLACNATGGCTGCTGDAQCQVAGHQNDTCGGGNPGTANVCGCTKTTCAKLAQTCGTPFDACYGNLACDTGTKNGAETDVDCGGDPTKCATRCGIGRTCSVDGDCASGHCADGVCCDATCDGPCEACTAAKKGAGTDGTCGAIKSATDPDNECADEGAASCGTTGFCNGAGACGKYASGTVCVAATCAGTATLDKAQTCDGNGACSAPATQACAPYQCTAGACTTTCTKDSQCTTGSFCDGSGQCAPLGQLGAACPSGAHECLSGLCVDGVCCDTACTGTCKACSAAKKGSGADGTCGPVAAGSDPDNECTAAPASGCKLDGSCDGAGACRNWVAGTVCVAASCATNNSATAASTCNGSGTCVAGATTACGSYACTAGACPTSCAMDTDCTTGKFCNGTSCVAKKANGGACPSGAHECTSGFCVDGVCCNNACTGACRTCSTGSCANSPDGQVDPRGVCVVSPLSTCGTDGKCQAGACRNYADGTPGCAPTTCSGSTEVDPVCHSGACNLTPAGKSCSPYVCGASACLGACATSADCIAGDYCDAASSICKAKLGNGAACTVADSCQNGPCGGGFCCKSTTACVDQGAASCGTNGTCASGSGACALYPTTQSCGDGCGDGTVISGHCSNTGTGSCVTSSTSCLGFACDSATVTCKTNCMGGDANCGSTYYCDDVLKVACLAKLAKNGVCLTDHQCLNGTCALGKCN